MEYNGLSENGTYKCLNVLLSVGKAVWKVLGCLAVASLFVRYLSPLVLANKLSEVLPPPGASVGSIASSQGRGLHRGLISKLYQQGTFSRHLIISGCQ